MALVVSGLEAASSMILEVGYAWQLRPIGFVVGLTLLTAEPWRHLLAKYRKALPDTGWIRAMTLTNLFGSAFLFPVTAAFVAIEHPDAVLITADMILFPVFMWLTAVVKGIMLRNAVPGSSISPSNVVVLHQVPVDIIGRTLGPPMARAAVQSGGQYAYAVQQFVLLLLATVFVEFGVVWPTREIESVWQ